MAEQPPAKPAFDNAKLYVWVKGLEGKVNNLLRQVDVLKNDLIKKNNQLKKEVTVMNDELLEVRRKQEDTVQKMDLIIKELKKTAGVEEVMTLKKYVDLWNPINFVTQRDVERVVESKLHNKKG
tara:strand:+ start:63 stop:434 length:372 start_codon:yes stop_codon:yes gene_type:complete